MKQKINDILQIQRLEYDSVDRIPFGRQQQTAKPKLKKSAAKYNTYQMQLDYDAALVFSKS